MQWLQDYSQFFNSIIIWFITLKIELSPSCGLLRNYNNIAEPQYQHVIDKIIFRHNLNNPDYINSSQEITLKKIYSGILDDPNVTEEAKAEWIIESITKNGQLRNKRVEIMIDLLNEKQYFFEEFFVQIYKRYKNLEIGTQEKVISYAFTHKDELPDSDDIEEKALELKNPAFDVFSDLSDDQQDKILENIENDISDPNGDAQKILEMKQIRNNLYLFRHRGENNPWEGFNKDGKNCILQHLATKELKELSLVARIFKDSLSNRQVAKMNKGHSLFKLGFKSKNAIIEFLKTYGKDIRVINLDNLDHCVPYNWLSAVELEEIMNYLPNLQKLTITGIITNKDAVQAIANCENMKNLTSLDLAYNNLDHEGAKALMNSPFMSKLRTLSLSPIILDDNVVLEIANSPNLFNLKTLCLIGSGIHNQGALAIANSENLKNLKNLILGSPNISDQGALAIANSQNLMHLKNLMLEDENLISPSTVTLLKNKFKIGWFKE